MRPCNLSILQAVNGRACAYQSQLVPRSHGRRVRRVPAEQHCDPQRLTVSICNRVQRLIKLRIKDSIMTRMSRGRKSPCVVPDSAKRNAHT